MLATPPHNRALVDEGIQSQGKWNMIGRQGVTCPTTIGTYKAGANGNLITNIDCPKSHSLSN